MYSCSACGIGFRSSSRFLLVGEKERNDVESRLLGRMCDTSRCNFVYFISNVDLRFLASL